MDKLTQDHPFYEQLAALRGWAEAEAARAAAGGERKLDRDALRSALDDAGIDPKVWHIDLDGATDAELIGQVELADESIWFGPAIQQGIEAIKAGRLITLYHPDRDDDPASEPPTDDLTLPDEFAPED